MAEDLDLLRASKAWPVVEAVGLIERLGGRLPVKGFVLFETGYGPSGLPHIGTFAEVFRTSLVRRVFELLSGWPTRLYAFSDDMDGLRAVPDNIPDRDKVAKDLHKPLTAIPDPFGTADSYGANMNQRLKSFLDGFGFDYEFVSATECYRSGRFNDALRRVLERHDAILRVVLPTLGPERRETYSPILPSAPRPGACSRCRSSRPIPRPARSPGGTRPAGWSSSRSSTAAPSCSGGPTGRCAGQRSGSTTRCTARI